MHTKEQLIGRKFTTATGSLYTLTDSPNTCNYLYVEWCKEDGHTYNGRSKYTLREVNTHLTKKSWILTDAIPQEVSNYSIF
jgi:hypothetical protein